MIENVVEDNGAACARRIGIAVADAGVPETLADGIVVNLGVGGAGIYLHTVIVVPDQIVADQVSISDRDHDASGDVAFVQAGAVDLTTADRVGIAAKTTTASGFVNLDADAVDIPHFAVVDQIVAGVEVEVA